MTTTGPHTPGAPAEKTDERRRCLNCDRPMLIPARVPGKRFCSGRCRVADWHRRNDRPPGGQGGADPDPAAVTKPTDAVNAVASGPNGVAGPAPGTGRCPHCSAPIAVISMLITPAAAHVPLPAPPPGPRP